MSEETKSAEVKVEAETAVVPTAETISETIPEPDFFDVFDAIPEKTEPPVEPEPSADEFEGHKISSNEAGDVFISKDGQCLGVAAGVFADEDHIRAFIAARANADY